MNIKEIITLTQSYFEKNNKVLKGDFSNQIEKFYNNTIQNKIIYSDEYSGNGEIECMIWEKNLKGKKILALDTEAYPLLNDGKHYMLISGLLYDDNFKTICIIHDKIEVLKKDRIPYKRIFDNNPDYDFINILMYECDYIIVHNYGADIPAISKAYGIPENKLKEKTLDTWVSCMMILGKQEKNFYSLVNLYKNLISYDVWISEGKDKVNFGTLPMLGHLLEIELTELDYFGLNYFKEHHPLFDAILTFLLFFEIRYNYEENTKYRNFHIVNK